MPIGGTGTVKLIPIRPVLIATPDESRGIKSPMKEPFDPVRNGPSQQHKTANDYLQEALSEREQFLARHMHLRSYQAEIDRVLDKSGNRQGRMAVLGTLLQGKLMEMQKELYKVTEILQETVSTSHDLQQSWRLDL